MNVTPFGSLFSRTDKPYVYVEDKSTAGVVYVGRALPGVAYDSFGWQIVRGISIDGVMRWEFADNRGNYAGDHCKWSERSSYFDVSTSTPILDSWFVLVRKDDFTESLLNRSVHHDVSELIEYTSRGVWAKIFPTSTKYYIIEVEKYQMQITSIYDNFEWFTRSEIEDLLNQEAD